MQSSLLKPINTFYFLFGWIFSSSQHSWTCSCLKYVFFLCPLTQSFPNFLLTLQSILWELWELFLFYEWKFLWTETQALFSICAISLIYAIYCCIHSGCSYAHSSQVNLSSLVADAQNQLQVSVSSSQTHSSDVTGHESHTRFFLRGRGGAVKAGFTFPKIIVCGLAGITQWLSTSL